jgi:hypothetical protein
MSSQQVQPRTSVSRSTIGQIGCLQARAASPDPGALLVLAEHRSSMIKGPTLKVYKGAPHGLCTTLKDQINEDVVAFLKG